MYFVDEANMWFVLLIPADFILVRDDYFEVPAESIWQNKVLATYVAGVQVFPHLTAPVDEESSH